MNAKSLCRVFRELRAASLVRRRRDAAVCGGVYLHQSLEPRRLLAVVDGTPFGDTIVVSQAGGNVFVNVNGGFTQTFGLEDLTLNAGDGFDTVIVSKYTAGQLTIDAGPGDDSIELGNQNASANLSTTLPVVLVGGSGDDEVFFHDGSSSGNPAYVVDPYGEDVVRIGSVTAQFDDFIESVRLLCNGQDNLIELHDPIGAISGPTGHITIEGGNGDDVCSASSFNDGGKASVKFVGGNGTQDRFEYDVTYSLAAAFSTMVVLPDSFSVEGHVYAEWAGIEQLDLRTDVFNDDITIDSIPAGLNATIRGGAGQDHYHIGGGDLDASILGSLTLPFAFEVSINDVNGGTDNDSYLIDEAGVLTKPGMSGSLTAFAAGIVLSANDGHNIIDVDLAGSHDLRGGNGNDSIILGNGNLLRNPGTTLSGGAGNDAVILDDSGPVTPDASLKNYEFASGAGTLFIDTQALPRNQYTYSAIEGITLNAGAYDSTFAINGLLGVNRLTVQAGGGDDVVNLGDGSSGFGAGVDLSLSGGPGSDQLNIDNSAQVDDSFAFIDGETINLFLLGLVQFNSFAGCSIVSGFGDDTLGIAAAPSTLSSLSFVGGDGDDLFSITPDDTTSISVDGGQPSRTPGDQLTLNGAGALGGGLNLSGIGAGSYTFSNRQTITFTGIDSLQQPPPAPPTPDLAQDDDSGVSDTDNVTRATTLTFVGSVTGTGTMTLMQDGVAVATSAAGNYAMDVTFPTGDQTFGMVAQFQDTGSGLASQSAVLTVRVDTISPSTPPIAPDLETASDTGISSTDNLTNDETPTFTVTGAELIRLLDGSSIVADFADPPSVASAALADGSHTIVARSVDVAGNVSGASGPVTIMIDTMAPPAPSTAPDLLAGSDSGVSSSDDITNDATPTFAVSGSELIQLLANSTVVADFASPGDLTSAPLTDGTYSITARSIDPAGNQSLASPALPLTIDTLGPAVTGVFIARRPVHPYSTHEPQLGRLVVRFSETMVTAGGPDGPNSVTNPSNWLLTRNGVDQASDIDAIGSLNSATVHEASINLASAYQTGNFLLMARENLRDLAGNVLDGDADGSPGGNMLMPFGLGSFVARGGEIDINTFTSARQQHASVAVDADGDYVVAWDSEGQDGSGYGVFAQRFNGAGVPVGNEFRVNTFTTDNQSHPSVAMDGDGNFVIAWQSRNQENDGSNGLYSIFAQRYDAAGIPHGGEFKVNTVTQAQEIDPRVAMNAAGQFVVAWGGDDVMIGDGGSTGISARRFDAAGVPQGGEFHVNTYTTSIQYRPAVAIDADGDFVITWQSDFQDGSFYGIYAQRFNASGVRLGSEFQVNMFTTDHQMNPAVAMDGLGNFVIAWQSPGQDGSNFGIFARRYSLSGLAQGGEFQVNTLTTNEQVLPSLAIDATGRFVIAWHSNLAGHFDVRARRFDADGTPHDDEFLVNTVTTGAQERPSVAAAENGDVVIVWQTIDPFGPEHFEVAGQRYGLDRTPIVATLADTPDPVVTGNSVTLVAGGVNDDDGTVVSVAFYRESNGIVGLQTGAGGDTLVAADSEGFDGWGITLSTQGLNAAAYAYYAQATDNEGLVGPPATTVNTVVGAAGPSVTASSFLFQSAPQRLTFGFDQNVSATLSLPDLTIQDLTHGTFVTPAALNYDSATNTATVDFSGILANANYRAVLVASGITNAGGTPMASDHTFDFFFLNGDANRDRVVDVTDLGILATHWQGTGNFSQADFNIDGHIDVTDLGILATNWQESLPAPATSVAAMGTAPPNPPFPAPIAGPQRRRWGTVSLADQLLT